MAGMGLPVLQGVGVAGGGTAAIKRARAAATLNWGQERPPGDLELHCTGD